MRRRRVPGFSLIELMFVIVVLALLLALGLGAFSRYRRGTALNQASEQMIAALQQTENEARNFGLPQMRAGVPLPASLTYATAEPNGDGVLRGRILEKRLNKGIELVRQFDFGDERRLDISFSNVPLAALTNSTAGDQGANLEIAFDAATETKLATFAFDPDGQVHTLTPNLSAFIYLGNDVGEYRIELTPRGKVTKTRTR